MEYAETIGDIKKRAAKIKTILDKADVGSRYAAQAIHNAHTQLNRIQNELALLEKTLQDFVGEGVAVKVGPSETKTG